jgi:hypothetical protein
MQVNAQEGTCNQKSWADQGLPSSPATLITSLYVHLSHLSVPSQTPWMPGQKCTTNDGPSKKKHLSLKVHKHEIFLNTFFAETDTLWFQGPVTRDF